MNDADVFLQAILAAPDDDAPRLAYADWLEERGDPRGEFIRVQCALERTPRHEPRPTREETKKCGCPWCVLKCRARVLCHEGYPVPGWAWAGAPLNQIPEAQYVFRRGFVDEATLSAAAWLAHADALTAAAPIREVRLTTFPQRDEMLAFLRDRGAAQGAERFDRAFGNDFLWDNPSAWRWLSETFWPRIKFTLPERAGPTVEYAERPS